MIILDEITPADNQLNMDLIELPVSELFVGMSLRFTLRDSSGNMLLAKGQKIDTNQQLDGIKSRQHVFVEIDQTDEGVRAVMSSFTALNRAGAPIKDFSKFFNVQRPGAPEDKQSGNLLQRWGDVESKLGGLLASVASTPDFSERLQALATAVDRLLTQDTAGSQLVLFNRAVTHFGGYSVLHALLCAVVSHALGDVFELSAQQRQSLVCAALSMNVAMTSVQNELALQKFEPSPSQRGVIDAHAAKGKQMLEQAGVTDRDWLTMVALHHTPLGTSASESLSDWPVEKRMVKILQTVDRYTAAMSPRKSRSGRTARDSVRAVVMPDGGTKHDFVGAALMRVFGLCPPGTFVKLANGETAVVMRRGAKAAAPWVASVLNRLDQPVAEPSLRDTAREAFAVQTTLVATAVRVTLNMETLLRMMPR